MPRPEHHKQLIDMTPGLEALGRTETRRAPRIIAAHELPGLRQSMSVGITSEAQARLIESCAALYEERARIASLLATLPEPFGRLRSTLNELQRALSAPVGAAGSD